jgi:asparagine synthase (glutamine-hydrolysing)
MLFEGVIFNENHSFNNEELYKKYDEVLIFDNGYFGIKQRKKSNFITNSYLGAFTSKDIETKFLSNLDTQSFVSFSLSEFLTRSNSNNLGVGAWYDEKEQTLVLSRELFGRVPFYYTTLRDQFTAFSTDLGSLLSNKGFNGHISINEGRISNYNTFLRDSAADYSNETFYTNVKSVLPGHLLTLSSNHISSKPYILLHPSRWSHLSTLEEFGEEFRSQFLNAVRSSPKNEKGLFASHLSGGMDSSSVSAAVKFLYPDNLLHTLYNKSNTIDSDENLFAWSVAKKIGSDHHEVLQSEEDFKMLRLHIPLSAQPSSTLLSPSFTGSLMQYAKSLGCDTIFNGSDGDSIVGSGLELINRVFEQRQWELVKDLLRKRVAHYSNTNQYPKWTQYSIDTKYNIVLQNFLFKRISAKMLQLPIKEFYQFYEEVSKHFHISYGYFIRRGAKSILDKIRKGQVTLTPSVLRDDLILRPATAQPGLIGLLETSFSSEQQQSLNDVFNAQAILSNEQNFVLSNHYDIVNSSPFYDQGLFELCMSVPDIIKYGDGIGRAHFREGMKGLLPDDVRCRSSKTHIRSHGQQVILRMYAQAEHFVADSTEIWKYVDRQKFNKQVDILRNDSIPYIYKINTWFHISRTISLAVWLEWVPGHVNKVQ